jgi:hypothetical protein
LRVFNLFNPHKIFMNYNTERYRGRGHAVATNGSKTPDADTSVFCADNFFYG